MGYATGDFQEKVVQCITLRSSRPLSATLQASAELYVMHAGTKMPKMLLVFYAVLLLTLMPTKSALACSCAKGQTTRSQFDKAEYVAYVKITASELRNVNELKNVPPDLFEFMSTATPEYVRVSFEEVEVYKGAKFSPNYLIELPFSPGNCMLGLLPGLDYVIFLGKDSLGLVFGCSGSFQFFNSSADTEVPLKIKELREWTKERR